MILSNSWGSASALPPGFRPALLILATFSRIAPSLSAQEKKGVPPVVARKPPAPPSGPTPDADDGKVDLSGVWVPPGWELQEYVCQAILDGVE
jgi:hypothetical protein